MTQQTKDVFATNEDQSNVDNSAANKDENFFEQLVGEGKKFKDQQALAKGKLESDQFISQLQTELAELRLQVKQSKSTEEMVAAIKKELHSAQNQSSREDTIPALDESKVSELVQQQLGRHEQMKIVEANVRKANDELLAMYGDKAPEVLLNKAEAMNLTIDDMKILAAKSPSAFISMFANDKGQVDTTTKVTKGSVNPQAMANTGKTREDTYGTAEYWAKQRKALGSKFWDPKIQQEVFKCKKDGIY